MFRARNLAAGVLVLCCAVFAAGLLPPVAERINREAVSMLFGGEQYRARLLFGYLDLLRNGEAANNLGVIYLRGLGVKRDRKKAIAYLEAAVERDVVAARYNLVLTMPNRHKTPEALVERQLSLLQQNVALGDIPSHVLLARRLYYVNREAFVPDREARKLELLAAAAATGDRHYIYQYGAELEVQAFKKEDAEMMIRALRAYRSAYDLGEIRGAEALGSARRLRAWNAVPSRAEILEKSEADWTMIAAQGGSITAKCRHGMRRFDWMDRLHEELDNPAALMASVESYLQAEHPVPWETSLAFLEECAKAKKLRFPPNPPFGEVALYARKRRGGWTALVNSPEWANYYLGQIHALGIHVEADRTKALEHFEKHPKFGETGAWIAYLRALEPG